LEIDALKNLLKSAIFMDLNCEDNSQDSTIILSLENDKATRITFSELGEDAYTNLDTEDAIVSSKMVNGSPALYVDKGNTISVSWAKENLYFILICEGLLEKDVLSISNSVVRIK
jgi:hypothetical protein